MSEIQSKHRWCAYWRGSNGYPFVSGLADNVMCREDVMILNSGAEGYAKLQITDGRLEIIETIPNVK